ncbi:CHAT domain-containing protein [Micromonospora sp. NBC_01796]|uniref:CHAT domain-containing protein n=1 Tax=Micromonospora sp. NBC_01796 TaxID=2975987 RepID=UPI002DDB3670|nr:CHAT domain-containing protein [Micromonospora sp. NBC_01796]WSA84152.1 CHAT domain-containing protein [Micromonospora sp. NBC_01796]
MTDDLAASVRRALARDDLLMLAADADQAVGIVRQREALSKLTRDEKSLFSIALEHYLTIAGSDEGWATKARAWKHAGVIVRFCRLVGIPVQMPEGTSYTTGEMHAGSLRELGDVRADGYPDQPVRDLTLHAFHRHEMARDLRLTGRFDEALGLAQVSPDALNAAGADPHMAHLMYETGAVYILRGQAAQVEDVMAEMASFWSSREGVPTRYRADLVGAVAYWATGDARAEAGLRSALNRVRAMQDAEQGIGDLSVTLAMAEYLAERDGSDEDRAEAVELGRHALRIADDVRGRWRVIARSRAPLAVVFQRVYGDIALLAARLGPEAAELGLRVALSAKQTGFAARIRTGRALMSPRVEGIINDIVDAEDGPRLGIDGTTGKSLDTLRFELEQAVSPMLADTVLPPPADLGTLTRVIGDRYALDYLELTDSLAEAPNLFRTLIRPGGRIAFERFEPDPFHAAFFHHARRYRNLAMLLNRVLDHEADLDRDLTSTATAQGAALDLAEFDWGVLARSVLPGSLLADLAADGPPIKLLISAHSWLSLVPWPALDVCPDDRRVRLVERAVITQTPAFTCLQHPAPPLVTGEALIRLVGRDEEGVDVRAERLAWGLPGSTDGVRLSECTIESEREPVRRDGRLADALRDQGRWGFVHIASHGAGEGLAQYLNIPGESLSFGRALGLKWPGSVLMASCHVGQVINVTEAEPITLVMALLNGGARCVVAGIDSVHDEGTGRAASHIVRAIRERPVSLDFALHDAQLAAVKNGAPEPEWALLGAYTQ